MPRSFTEDYLLVPWHRGNRVQPQNTPNLPIRRAMPELHSGHIGIGGVFFCFFDGGG